MKTEVIMRRNLLGVAVRQRHKSGHINAKDLCQAARRAREARGLREFNTTQWLKAKSTQEFIEDIERSYDGPAVLTVKGRLGGTWLHPLLAVDLALALDSKVKLAVYEWLLDGLLEARDRSGDSYRLMCGQLQANYHNKAQFHLWLPTVARKIKQACNVLDWQDASKDQLHLREKLHVMIGSVAEITKHSEESVDVAIAQTLHNHKVLGGSA